MKKVLVSLLLLLLTILLITNCKDIIDAEPNFYGDNVTIVEEDGPIPKRVELDQGWDQQTRMDFWFTSQGSEIIPYSWFVNLELADSEKLLRSSEHMEELRYMPFPSNQINPGGLPIGFTISKALEGKEHWVGLTCAACHTNQLDYKGTKMLIEGAPTLANFGKFFDDMIKALQATKTDDAKFERFAKKVLANIHSETAADSLRSRLALITKETEDRQHVNRLAEGDPADLTSWARLDAFGEIQNAGTAFALNDLTNRNPPNAPVSYPFIWGTHQSDVVQWNGSAQNTPSTLR